MDHVFTVVEKDEGHTMKHSLTLFIFKAFICTTHSFSGMRYFLFGCGKEERRDEVAEGRKKGY